MATSGSKSITVTSYDTLKFSWERTSYSVADNTSTIKWSLQLIAGSAGAISSSYSKKWSVTINGTTYSGTNTISISNNTTKTLASGSNIVIKHNNDGSKSFSYSFNQTFDMTFAGSYIGSKSGSGTGELDKIARSATITSADNFNDEANPSIIYNNPLGNSVSSVEVCITSADGYTALVGYRTLSKTGSSYTFNDITEAERKALRKYIDTGTSKTIAYYIKTVLNGTSYYNYVFKTLSLVNYLPSLNPTIIDTNSKTVALTGNANTIIKNFNSVKCTINSSANKEATIYRNYIKNGTTYYTVNEYTFTNTNSNYFKFTVEDSRGNTSSKEYNVNMINYIPLTCSVDADIVLDTADNTKANITFTAKGNYFNSSFGAANNTLSLSYTVTDSNNNKTTKQITIPSGAISGNAYTVSGTITGLDYKESYSVEIAATDKLISNVKATSKLLKAIPLFDWSETDFNFNVPVYMNNIELDYIVEQGIKDGWFYRKWNSGLAECWQTTTVSGVNVSEFTLDGFKYSGSKAVNFPFTFKTVTYTNASGGSTGNINIVRGFSYTTTNMSYLVLSLANNTSATIRVNLEAKGTWK